MKSEDKPTVILVAEDNESHFILTRDAFEEASAVVDLRRVENGEDLIDYLLRRGPFQDRKTSPSPSLILMDLNMPKMNGRDAVTAIRSNPFTRRIPVVVLTTSRSDEDVNQLYHLGVNSYLRKPSSFSQFVEVIKILKDYWLEIVERPPGD